MPPQTPAHQPPSNPSQLDLLNKIETLTSDIDSMMRKRSRSVFRRYPLTFGILALFGVVAVSEGAKGILDIAGLGNHPTYMFFPGLVILIVTGFLYKNLDK